jgi:hypothetical protein
VVEEPPPPGSVTVMGRVGRPPPAVVVVLLVVQVAPAPIARLLAEAARTASTLPPITKGRTRPDKRFAVVPASICVLSLKRTSSL